MNVLLCIHSTQAICLARAGKSTSLPLSLLHETVLIKPCWLNSNFQQRMFNEISWIYVSRKFYEQAILNIHGSWHFAQSCKTALLVQYMTSSRLTTILKLSSKISTYSTETIKTDKTLEAKLGRNWLRFNNSVFHTPYTSLSSFSSRNNNNTASRNETVKDNLHLKRISALLFRDLQVYVILSLSRCRGKTGN